MKQLWNQLTCLNCGNKIIQISEMILNPGIDHELKNKILNDTWMTSKCATCGKIVRSIYPCIYKDVENKYLIHVKKVFDVDESEYKQRYVNDRESFIELVKIIENKEDDQKIMKIKKILYQTHQLVEFISSDEEYIVFNCDGQIKMVKNTFKSTNKIYEMKEYKK